MEVTKTPPVEPSAERGPASPAQQQLPPPLSGAALLDRVDIQPLDLVGALLILIAEVRAGFAATGIPLPPEVSPTGPAAPNTVQAAPGQAPQVLVRLFLASLPEEELLDQSAADAPRASSGDQKSDAWAGAAAALESAMSVALDNGVTAVSAWREVPPSVVASVEDVRAVVLAVLGGASVNAEWLRPEWLGLAPRLERYWRRRRTARRGLSNPDHEGRAGRAGRENRDDELGSS